MSDPTEEEAVEAIKSMGIIQDEEQIREALRRCDNNPQVRGGRGKGGDEEGRGERRGGGGEGERRGG